MGERANLPQPPWLKASGVAVDSPQHHYECVAFSSPPANRSPREAPPSPVFSHRSSAEEVTYFIPAPANGDLPLLLVLECNAENVADATERVRDAVAAGAGSFPVTNESVVGVGCDPAFGILKQLHISCLTCDATRVPSIFIFSATEGEAVDLSRFVRFPRT